MERAAHRPRLDDLPVGDRVPDVGPADPVDPSGNLQLRRACDLGVDPDEVSRDVDKPVRPDALREMVPRHPERRDLEPRGGGGRLGHDQTIWAFSGRRRQVSADRSGMRREAGACRRRLTGQLIERARWCGPVDLETEILDEVGDRAGAVFGPIEVINHRGGVREHMDDGDLGSIGVEVGREHRGSRLRRRNRRDGAPEHRPEWIRGVIPQAQTADEDDRFGHRYTSERACGRARYWPSMQSDDGALARLTSNRRARRLRRFWRTLPSAPRCKMCNSPFAPPMGPVLRLVGKGRWPGNPAYCRGCFRDLYNHRDGAEVESTSFFADVRGSTALAETMAANEFRALMDRFYEAAAQVLIEHEAVVDKFVGDEVVGIFVPALAGPGHARQAIEAALALLRATGNDGADPWVPIGIGVNTGVAYVGAVGTADHVEFTALGDAVNVAARLASAAGPGELLITTETAAAADYPVADRERRSLELRGKSAPTGVFVIRADRSAATG